MSEPNKIDELKEKISKLDYKIIEDKGNYKIVQKLSDNLIEAIMAVIDTYTQEVGQEARIDEWERMAKQYPTAPYIPDFIWKKRLNQLKDSKEIE